MKLTGARRTSSCLQGHLCLAIRARRLGFWLWGRDSISRRRSVEGGCLGGPRRSIPEAESIAVRIPPLRGRRGAAETSSTKWYVELVAMLDAHGVCPGDLSMLTANHPDGPSNRVVT